MATWGRGDSRVHSSDEKTCRESGAPRSWSRTWRLRCGRLARLQEESDERSPEPDAERPLAQVGT